MGSEMIKSQASYSSLLMWILISGLFSQHLVIPVLSAATTFEDQKTYYSPPTTGTPPTGHTPSQGTPPSHGDPNCSPTPSGHGGGSHGTPPTHHHGGGGHHGTPTPSGGGSYGNPPTPRGGGGGSTDPGTPTTPSPGGSGGYYPSPPTGGHGTPPVIVTPPVIIPPVTGTPPVIIPPVTGTPPVIIPPVTGTPHYPPIVVPGSPGYTIPGINVPASPPFVIDPNTPFTGTCNFWSTHPSVVWGLVGFWGTLGGAFGASSFPGSTPTLSLPAALTNTATNGYGALYREGTASLLNSIVNHRTFPYSTTNVRDSFMTALVSNRAAGAQAQLFKMANEGKLKKHKP